MINLIKLQCPNCGANLEVREDAKQCFCTYCGLKLLLHNENEKTVRIIDEARMQQVQYDSQLKEKALDRILSERSQAMSVEEARLNEKRRNRSTRHAIGAIIWSLVFGFGILLNTAVANGRNPLALTIAISQLVMTWASAILKSMGYKNPIFNVLGHLLMTLAIVLMVPWLYCTVNAANASGF